MNQLEEALAILAERDAKLLEETKRLAAKYWGTINGSTTATPQELIECINHLGFSGSDVRAHLSLMAKQRASAGKATDAE